jgi:hypothetical protein
MYPDVTTSSKRENAPNERITATCDRTVDRTIANILKFVVDEWRTVMFTIMVQAKNCHNHNSISLARMVKSRLSITRRRICLV